MPRVVRTLLLFAATLFVSATAWAQLPFTLSGTVYGGGTPLSGVVVEALQDGTTTVVAATTTNAAGQYSLSLPAATYDLRVTPPSGSGFGQETIQDIVMSANRQQDIILLATGSGSLSGVVTGYQGQPVPGATIVVQPMSTFSTVASAVTDAAGQFTVGLASGTYRVVVSGSNRPNAPASFNWDRRSVSVTGAQQFDVALPVVRLNGAVTTAAGSPVVANVQASTSQSSNPLFTSSSVSVTTATDGQYSVLLLAGTASLTVRPQSGSGLGTVFDSLVLSGDSTRNYVLPQASTSGTLRGYNGQPVSGASVQIYTWPAGQFIASASTNTLGQFVLPVGAGTYRLYATAFNRPNSPMSWNWDNRNFVVVDGTPADIQLPVVRLTGNVQDTAGSPVPAAILRMTGNSNSGTTLFLNASGQHTVDAQGQFDILTFPQATTVSAAPPAGSSLGLVVEVLSLTADSSRTFVLPDNLRITGTARGYAGQPVPFASISLYIQNTGTLLATTQTDASGNYSLPAAAGTFRLILSTSARPNITPSGSLDRRAVTVSGPTLVDFDLPVLRINGRTIDSNGVAVPNVTISGSSFLNDFTAQKFQNSSANTVTTATGAYSLLLFAGTGTLTFQPPAASGFAGGQLSNLALSGDVNQVVILQRPDTTAPSIVSGPAVIHLSDSSVSVAWTTDEPATSSVAFGISGLTSVISDNTPVTTHIVTLTGLDPLAIYTYQVSSVDRSGNGPTSSAQVFFTTQAPPGDITAPVITDGPTVAFVDQTSAIIQWTTDEPATSGLDYGDTPDLGTTLPSPLGQFRQSHSVRVTGLTPAATYFVRVTSADPDGNAVASSVFTLTTLTVPDTQAPVLTEGPTAGSISDTRMTITWRTDEPSTSGVSYNDGTTFNVANDGAFVRQHSVTLTGLRPSTTYQITISSTDAVGNGPTIGGPITATTNPTPDTTGPAITALAVSGLGETTATIGWTTDEPSTSSVAYGTVSGSPSDSKGDVALVTDHRIVLTGLSDGTTYYVTVTSRDAAGNTSSQQTSFATPAAYVDTPPTAPGTPSALPNPSRTGAFVLSWNAATDDLGIAGYDILRGGTAVASVGPTVTTYSESGVAEGAHVYRIRVRDSGGHAAESNPLTVVVDLTAPTLLVPSDASFEAAGPSGTDVNFTVLVADNFDAQPAVSCSAGSGSRFPLGNTTVTCTATDAAGNVATSSFVVTVRDSIAPTLNLPADIATNATDPNGAVVSFTVSAVDGVDTAPKVTCSHASGATFPVGTSTIACRATDASGNVSADGSFTVTVAGATSQMGQAATLIASFALPAEIAEPLTVKLDQALAAPTDVSACGNLQSLINSTEAQRRARKITAEQADAIIAATVQIMVVQGCR